MHQIENEFLKVKARNYGAELISVYYKQSQTEHLWQADEKYWAWHAPVLFPVIGRCWNDEIVVDEESYRMEKHGFARKSDFRLLELSETKMIFSLSSSIETLKIYPYHFELLIGYQLKENQLVCSYEVINKDEKSIYFQLGGHPAFAVPFNLNERYEDYYFEFDENENSWRHLINKDGFFDGRQELVFNNSDRIPLRNDLFKHDALIFKDLKSRKVSIKSKKRHSSLTLDFHGFNYLGLWAKENAPYVCIEPWLGCADTDGRVIEFSKKEAIIELQPNKRFNCSFDIKVS